jgi:chromosome partitioning protein
MLKTCSACGAVFTPAFVYQMAVTPERQQLHFCTVECRRTGLGDESFRTRRARRTAILNHATGTGKTTTAVSVASGMAERGQRVLLIDTDVEGNLGPSLGIRGDRSLLEVLVHDLDYAEAIVPIGRSLDVITGNPTLAAAETWLAEQALGERAGLLARRLGRGHVSRRYDHVVLDCGPSLDLLTQNALSYADEVVIPVACDERALDGTRQVLHTIREIERHLHHAVRLAAVLPTFFDPSSRAAADALAALQDQFKDRCLPPIRTDPHVADAPSFMRSVFEHAPDCDGARDYTRAVDWLLGRMTERTIEAADHVAA